MHADFQMRKGQLPLGTRVRRHFVPCAYVLWDRATRQQRPFRSACDQCISRGYFQVDINFNDSISRRAPVSRALKPLHCFLGAWLRYRTLIESSTELHRTVFVFCDVAWVDSVCLSRCDGSAARSAECRRAERHVTPILQPVSHVGLAMHVFVFGDQFPSHA